jgi:hypothetical protein
MILEGLTLFGLGKIKTDSLLGQIYNDAAQPTVKKVGEAIGEVFELVLSPVLLFKFGNEALRLKYKHHLDNFAKKLEEVADEDVAPVNPQIGVPILDKLTYTSNEEIAGLFINLLAKASSNNTVNLAHPAFIQIIERLSVDEARIIKSLKYRDSVAFIGFKAVTTENDSYSEIFNYGTALKFENLEFPENCTMYIHNLISLGFFKEESNTWLTDNNLYEDLRNKYLYDEYLSQLSKASNFKELRMDKGFFKITDFGKAFINACAI